MRRSTLHLLFFASGVAALLYQVLWVREFGNLFGNSVLSASLVTALFMAGLGVGGQLAGARVDRSPSKALLFYGWVEVAIGAWGLGIAVLLPYVGRLSAALSSYREDGPYLLLSHGSWALRGSLVVALLLPSTLLMGATLTLLLKHVLVSPDRTVEGWRTGTLYGANTAGAAVGALLADFLLVPRVGSFFAQGFAVAVNLAIGAFVLFRARGAVEPAAEPAPLAVVRAPLPLAAGATLFLSGAAGMGLEILWFRFFSAVWGGTRSVFALLLSVLLVSMWLGAVAAGRLTRRFERPATAMMVCLGLLAVSTVALLQSFDVTAARDALEGLTGLSRGAARLWPVARTVALPGALMGAAFPLMNALIQQSGGEVGRRAGALYLFNTAGAVVGALGTALVLLPLWGTQRSVLPLVGLALLSMLPLALAAKDEAAERRTLEWLLPAAMIPGLVAMAAWSARSPDALLKTAFVPVGSDAMHIVAAREGVNEVSAVVEWKGHGRALYTNGHSMSGTTTESQRYMRAMAHVPLLLRDAPERALVICFGVGNTVHAASMHPLKELHVAELSRDVVSLSPHFSATNGNVLSDPRVRVFLLDGRQHLRMQPEESYDLITLEPPPISFAGVGALYSRDFYALAKSRLRPGGLVTQWLPSYQVDPPSARSMAATFVAEFPDAVLLYGSERELVLMGSKGGGTRARFADVERRLSVRPAVDADLSRFGLATKEGFGKLLASSTERLTAYTNGAPLVTDDRPLNEYADQSRGFRDVDAALTPGGDVASWCEDCP